MQRMLLKTVLLFAISTLLLQVETVGSEAIANTEKKEGMHTSTVTNLTNKFERPSSHGKDTAKPTVKLHGNLMHKLRRDSKVDGERLKNFFHFINSFSIHPTKNQHFGSETKQVRISSQGDSKLKNMLKALSNVKKFPKKFFDLKKQKNGYTKPVLDSGNSKNTEIVLPREQNDIQMYTVNFNDGQRFSTPVPHQDHSVRDYSSNFVNQHNFRTSQDKIKDDPSVTDSGIRAFHFQNIGVTKNPILTPVFDHSAPVTLIEHFERDNMFAFHDPDFSDHSSSAESGFNSSQELIDFNDSYRQLFDGSGFITYDTLLNHGLVSSAESGSTSDHDFANSKDANINPAIYNHHDSGFTNFRDDEQRHKHGNADHPGFVIQNPYHTNPDYHIYAAVIPDTSPNSGSVVNFGHSSTRFTDSSAIQVHDSTNFKHFAQNPIQFEYSQIRPASGLSSAVDAKSHHLEHRPTYKLRNVNSPHIKASQDLADNDDFHYNLQNHNINSVREPNINQIHIYKFLKPTGSQDLNQVTSFRIFQSSNENSDTKYIGELSDSNSSSDPDVISSTDYHNMKSTSDIFNEPSKIELIPFGPEDRMPDKKSENFGSNSLGDNIPSISSFAPSEGARGALKIASATNYQSDERSNLEGVSRFHGVEEANRDINSDLDWETFQNLPHRPNTDDTKLKKEDQKPLLQNNERYYFTNSGSDFYSDTKHNFNHDGSQINEPLTITDYEETNEKNIGKPINVGDDYVRSNKLRRPNSFSGENLESNYENEDNIYKFRSSVQSINENIKPLCYALPTSYIPYPPYAKSRLICA